MVTTAENHMVTQVEDILQNTQVDTMEISEVMVAPMVSMVRMDITIIMDITMDMEDENSQNRIFL